MGWAEPKYTGPLWNWFFCPEYWTFRGPKPAPWGWHRGGGEAISSEHGGEGEGVGSWNLKISEPQATAPVECGLRGCVGEDLPCRPLEYRLCFQNGWFIKCKLSVTKEPCTVLPSVSVPRPGPWPFLSLSLWHSPLPPPRPLAACAPLHLAPLCFPGRFTRKQPVSMATWRQLKNGS